MAFMFLLDISKSLYVHFMLIDYNCPSARCASAVNIICRDAEMYGNKTSSLIDIYKGIS
jgi:hypothetical protein